MEKTGITITKRKDGRYVGKFITDYDISGKAYYQYVYGKTYDEAEQKVLIGREIASRFLSGRYITVGKIYVWDIGNHIDKTYIHRYPDGELCLETEAYIALCFYNGYSLLQWMKNIVEPYYFSYENYTRFGEFPFGDRGHNLDSVIETYQQIFHENDLVKCVKLLHAISQRKYKGHLPCPCESGLITRKCHGRFMDTLIYLPKRVKVGIVLKVAERIYEHYHYHEISIKIDAIQSHAERDLTAETVKELQGLIDERLKIPVLEINIIHRLKAKQYSSSYEEIS